MTLMLVLLLQLLTGMGVIACTNTRLPKSMVIPLGLLVGMFVHSMAFFGVDLIHWGLSFPTMIASGMLTAVASHCWIHRVREFYSWLFSNYTFSLRMYDVVALGFALTTGYYVVWAAWFWPVTPFDAMAGIDLVAREAVNQGTINNRVFTDASLAGFLSNQPFYAPFAMLMQVMYRLLGFGYGQVWLGVMAIAASWCFWSVLRQYSHPFVANILWLLLILTPEFLGYTYLLQTDYLNAVYFSLGVMLLVMSVSNATKDQASYKALPLAAILLAGACWSRTETILLVGIGLAACLVLWQVQSFKKEKLTFMLSTVSLCGLAFFLWNGYYLQSVLPVRPDTASELVGFSTSRFVEVTSSTFSNVVADAGLWGIAFILFTAMLLVNVFVKRNAGNIMLLAWIIAALLGLLIVGTVFSAAIVEQTLRRGMFKLLPLLFLYIAALPIVQEWGLRLQQWEKGKA